MSDNVGLDEGIKRFYLSYEEADEFFVNMYPDYNDMCFVLDELTEDEQGDFLLCIYLDIAEKIAKWRVGNIQGKSDHLFEFTDDIDDSLWTDLDYGDVLGFLTHFKYFG